MNAKKILKKVGVVAFIGAAYYCTSDVGKARIDDMHDNYANWTAENIEKFPELYLKSSEKDLKGWLDKIKDMQISTTLNAAGIKAQLDSKQEDVRVGTSELERLRQLYKKESMAWPVLWNGRSLGEKEYEEQVTHLHRDVEHKKKEVTKLDRNYRDAKQMEVEVGKSMAEVKTRLSGLQSQKDSVKIMKMNEELSKQMQKIRTVMEKIPGKPLVEDEPGLVGVDDLVATRKSEKGISREEFHKAMGW